MPRVFCPAILALVLVAPFAAGREITVKLTATEIDKVPYVVPLIAPAAYCAAAGDALGMVAVGHKVDKQARLSLFRLNAKGKPAGAPLVVKLPKPAILAARDTYPLSLAFHPTLPLLYVWQEVEGLKGDPVPPDEPAWKDFDHLLIYSLEKAPELLVALCRGPLFHTGNVAGSLGLDVGNGLLYIPNLRFAKRTARGRCCRMVPPLRRRPAGRW